MLEITDEMKIKYFRTVARVNAALPFASATRESAKRKVVLAAAATVVTAWSGIAILARHMLDDASSSELAEEIASVCSGQGFEVRVPRKAWGNSSQDTLTRIVERYLNVSIGWKERRYLPAAFPHSWAAFNAAITSLRKFYEEEEEVLPGDENPDWDKFEGEMDEAFKAGEWEFVVEGGIYKLDDTGVNSHATQKLDPLLTRIHRPPRRDPLGGRRV